MTKNIDIKDIEINKGQIEGLPKNPRFIRDKRFDALKKSIEDAPEMLELRELLVFPFGGKYVVIGGNQRFRACRELGFRTLPCKVIDPETPVEKLREYTIKDNNGFGEDDSDILANEWDFEELKEWGMEFKFEGFDDGEEEPDQDDDIDDDGEIEGESFDYRDVLYESDNEFEIPNLLLDRMAGKLELPFTPWGANSRLTKGVNTYHFYVDDYRFEKLFKDPINLVTSGCKAIIEPNCSLHDQTPIAFGLNQIYKKRYLARYMQELGVDVYVDLNVAEKFRQYNRMGIPKGWNAFFTRGLADFMVSLDNDLKEAREISGKDTPNLIVYGGGAKVREYCNKNGLLYVQDFINDKF